MDHFRLDEQGLLAAGARLKAAHELRPPPPPGAGDLPSAELAIAFGSTKPASSPRPRSTT
ncbi:MAG: hypothetical protein LBS56_00680 [Propionibacteriaceae bacterium]|jgi:hypothetical protein|nr:hypothetical protein [Propionibacteriaceae bacterium]